jgi:flagellar basal-body rod protein FlgB
MRGVQTELLARLLGACQVRARVIGANIANQNTPGYTRSVVRFEELLRDSLGSSLGTPGSSLASWVDGRRAGLEPGVPGVDAAGIGDAASLADHIEPQIVPDLASPARPDGNNVSLELELNEMRENRLLYETYAAILQSHFALLETAITEGR